MTAWHIVDYHGNYTKCRTNTFNIRYKNERFSPYRDRLKFIFSRNRKPGAKMESSR